MSDLRATLRQLVKLDDCLNVRPWPKEGRELPPSTFLLPEGEGPFPAILYCHAHGGNYDRGRRELTEGAGCFTSPYAPLLTGAGFAVLCIDMPGFNDRQDEGTEGALAKTALWHGRTLFGGMLADLMGALDWLAQHPQVDPKRIVSFGISMGAAHAYWLAALDDRISAVVQMCMMADIGPLIEAGAHDRHNHYLTVPGFLTHAETGDVAGLVAPRPQFVGHGGEDVLTPPAARDPALARLRAAYGGSSALTTFLAEGAGHEETPEMRAALLEFLARTAAQPQPK